MKGFSSLRARTQVGKPPAPDDTFQTLERPIGERRRKTGRTAAVQRAGENEFKRRVETLAAREETDAGQPARSHARHLRRQRRRAGGRCGSGDRGAGQAHAELRGTGLAGCFDTIGRVATERSMSISALIARSAGARGASASTPAARSSCEGTRDSGAHDASKASIAGRLPVRRGLDENEAASIYHCRQASPQAGLRAPHAAPACWLAGRGFGTSMSSTSPSRRCRAKAARASRSSPRRMVTAGATSNECRALKTHRSLH